MDDARDDARHAERRAILREIDGAVSAGAAPATIARAALRRLRALLGAPRAVVTLFDLAAGEGEWLAVDVDTPTAIGSGVRFPLVMMGDLDGLRRGEPQVIEDVAVFAHLAQAQALLAEGIHAFAVLPLIAGGGLIGSLNFGSRAPGPIRTDQIEIAREVAARVAVAIGPPSRVYASAGDPGPGPGSPGGTPGQGERVMAQVLTVVAKIRAAKGKGDALAALLQEQAGVVRKNEPGCLVYRPHRSTKDPDVFLFYEQYKDDAAFDAHRKALHLASYRERREKEGLTEGAVEVEIYRSLTD